MKKTVAKLTALLLAMMMLLSFTACGEAKKAVQFVKDTTEVMTSIQTQQSDFETKLNAFVGDPTNAEAKQALVDVLTQLEESYTKFGQLVVPKKYEEVQPMFKEVSDDALAALKIYKEEFTNFDQDTTDPQKFVENLTKGDELMNSADNKRMELAQKLQDLDK